MSQHHSEIALLSPSNVWEIFDKICSIPHPSYHEEALANYIVNWAQELKLDVKRDKIGNIFIKKSATSGMEKRKTVVLQAHLDMVPQKNEDTEHDFTTDPIRPYIDGEWVTADGTTLGADNGIGMATCLAVLASTNIEHGPLEVLLTINEEAGMEGAFGLEAGWLDADILLNTDSEQEGEVYVGCAGGINGLLELPITREPAKGDSQIIKLELKGLKGGHSGVDIHLGRGNANKLLSRFLAEIDKKHKIQLIDFSGGTLRNAIPREGSVTIQCPKSQTQDIIVAYEQFVTLIKKELIQVEPNIVAKTDVLTEHALDPITLTSTNTIINTLNATPNGVISMSNDVPGIVETSLNIGIVSTEFEKLSVLILVRSLIDSGREYTESMVTSIAQLAGADVRFYDAYPGWKPDTESEVMAIFRDKYQEVYGAKPNIMVIHAGLECGLFKQPYPQMDMISFGPTIKFPHSPDEKVKIDTVGQFWQQMVMLLKNIPSIN
ncbi:aminoacyl-histidine dipeptidase [Vibrio sp. RC27]